ncbi:MAG: T9SS type A sorting domain-containing protein [Flavobacteriales bacterium]|nr:T9SS type A sorting domain-containing protein [Flavobacteriales bacterium]
MGSKYCGSSAIQMMGWQRYENDNDRSDTLDLLNQHLFLDVTDFSGHTISGVCSTSFTSLQPNVNSISFDLIGMTIDSIHGANEDLLSYSYSDDLLVVHLPSTLSPGDTSEVDIYYHGTPTQDASGWGGWYWAGSYAFNLGVGFAAEPHNYGRAWFPCFDNFAERSTYSFSVLTSAGKNAWCNGMQISTDSIGGDSIVSHWVLDRPIPSYLVSVAVASYVSAESIYTSTTGTEIPVFLTAKANDTTAVKSSFTHLPDALMAFENHYGPYLWPRVGYAFVPFNSGAMEHATNIAYPLSFASGDLSFETLMAHELSHHWWGDLVTCRYKEDMWLNEGLASFSEWLFLEQVEGPESYHSAMLSNHKDVLTEAHISDGGYYPVSGIGTENTYGDHVYNKGAEVAHNLRRALGDEAFFAGLTHIQTEYENQTITSEQFRDALGEIVATDISPLFDPMIFNPGFCEFSIDSTDISESSGNFDVLIYLRQKLHHAPDFYYEVPLEVTVMDSTGLSESFTITAGGEFSMASVSTQVNPHKVLLEFNSLFNQAVLAETIVRNQTGIESASYPEFFLDVNAIEEGDSLWIRVENHWVGADPEQTQVEYHIADDRYWRIDGFIPESADIMGRITYYGNPNGSNYYDPLFFESLQNAGQTEDSLILLYRPHPGHIWEEHNNYELNTQGSATNWQGQFKFYQFRPGDYAWAYRTGEIGIAENGVITGEVLLYPNPTTNGFTCSSVGVGEIVRLIDNTGNVVYEGKGQQHEIHHLPNGAYQIQINGSRTTRMGGTIIKH